MISTLGFNRLPGILSFIFILLLSVPFALTAEETSEFDSQTGSTTFRIGNNIPQQPMQDMINIQFGWPRRMLGDASLIGRCPTILDFDDNNDMEVSVITAENRLYVYQHDGANYPSFPLQPHIGNRPRSWNNPSHPAVSAIGNIAGPDKSELVYCTDIGYLHAVNVDGVEPDAFPVDLGLNVHSGIPALIDLDENDSLEIIINTISSHPDSLEAQGIIHVINGYGEELNGWPARYPRGSTSSPAVGNIDDNSEIEIVVGNARYLDRPAQVWAWHEDGTVVDGFPVGRFETVNGHPTLADLNNDGMLEILVWAAEFRGETAGIWAWNGYGDLLQGFPLETGSGHPHGGPVVADLNRDEFPDIAFGTADPHQGAQIFAWSGDGQPLENFPIQLESPSVVGSVLIADISGDRFNDIIAAVAPEEGAGAIHAWHSNAEPVEGFPITLDNWDGGAFAGTPTIWDVDRDGDLDLVAATTGRRIMVWDTRGLFRRDSWFSYKGGMTRTAVRPVDDPQDVKAWDSAPKAEDFNLLNVAPNPFNRFTTLSLNLKAGGFASIDLFDLAGRKTGRIFSGNVEAGSVDITFDAGEYDLSAGLYLCRWRCGDASGISRMVYLP